MVLGGGISGIQASLDLASLGFRVYLVDKAPMQNGPVRQDFSHQ
jgi:heterodisulfide reductase subunit A